MPSFVLNAYLKRLGLAHPGPPAIEGLRSLHAAHVEAIPFENLDILLGRGIRLDIDYLRDKLITQQRGGYCFEQNTLFLSVLRDLGYRAEPMEARVSTEGDTLLPRTHMAIVVESGSRRWLADVGFGGEGIFEPVPMDGAESAQASGLAYRVVREGDEHVLQMRHGRAGEWADQYAFLERPVRPVDFDVANWFTSTHPESPFVRRLTVQRATRDVRYVLRYPRLIEIDEQGTRTREISRADLMPTLRRLFRIDLPDDTRFRVIDATD